jgi:hypothetical protein
MKLDSFIPHTHDFNALMPILFHGTDRDPEKIS